MMDNPTYKERIEKIHKETCVKELKEASVLNGNETKNDFITILGKCQCIQIAILFNGFNKRSVA